MSLYSQYYKQDTFWETVKKIAIKAGAKVIYNAMLLFYVLQKPEVPANIKVIITGALGYLIFPLDAIPDFTPVVGYTDDIGALLLAVGIASMYIDEDVKNKAKSKLKDWFGNAYDESVLEND